MPRKTRHTIIRIEQVTVSMPNGNGMYGANISFVTVGSDGSEEKHGCNSFAPFPHEAITTTIDRLMMCDTETLGYCVTSRGTSCPSIADVRLGRGRREHRERVEHPDGYLAAARAYFLAKCVLHPEYAAPIETQSAL